MSGRRKMEGADCGRINPQKPLWSIGKGIEIVDQDPDDLSKPQGDDGQIIPAQPENGETQQNSEKRGQAGPDR